MWKWWMTVLAGFLGSYAAQIGWAIGSAGKTDPPFMVGMSGAIMVALWTRVKYEAEEA